MLEIICWLAAIVVVCGCFSLSSGPERFLRDKAHPWVLLGTKGSVKVDMDHPEWQKNFRRQLREIEKIRRAYEEDGE